MQADQKQYIPAVLRAAYINDDDEAKTPSLKLVFQTGPRDDDRETYYLSLHPKMQERNQSYLERLGVRKMPSELTASAIRKQGLPGLGTTGVTLVKDYDEYWKEVRVRWINECREVTVK